ncbi:MAG: P-type conjugative transfer protein TrbG [Sphingomicrobium sp.]
MNIRACLLAASAAALGACAGPTPAHAATPSNSLVAARRISEPVILALMSDSLASGKVAARYSRPDRRRDRAAPVSHLEAAAPEIAAPASAMRIYPWQEGALYTLEAAPERVSDIALQPGEGLIAVAAGDTVRWVIGDTASGAGSARRTHILVKPSAPGLATNLVITTDRRVYHLDLHSGAGSPTRAISWSYPQDELLALRRAEQAAAAAAPVADGIAVEALNFGYRIDGDEPSWRPLRAFDDGRQVFIEFPADLTTGEAPPLFVLGPKGAAELVNYRVRGHYYVVDRLFSVAELRLGEKRQQVVRITRSNDAGSRDRRGRAS